ncbi:ABC transporter permease [Rhodocytophaga rosea]|uniref:ABC transporter permease n=1 Tax=Rhodocytophaga rosea TaxID=2704465 RepID=A0A6C0GG80_9BACT|nr:ABC transporter permease [Rhodocytophaga rosea]QHT66834.1 ABC transporter permease [Rhodocytophaga rosea]
MDKILLIIQREYLVRVKKKSFIIMTFLGPLLIGGIWGVSIWLSVKDDENRVIEVIDESGLFSNAYDSKGNLTFIPAGTSLEQAKQDVRDERYYALLYIPKIDIENPEGIKLYSKKGLSISVEGAVENKLKKEIEDKKLIRAGIDKQILEKIDTDVSVSTLNLSEGEGEEGSSAGVSYIVGFASAFIIYLSIFIYGVQVMRGVIEEKTNRIIEVIISSVKPFQLMLGKIIGIAFVGLTQFLLWIIFGFIVSSLVFSISGADKLAEQQAQTQLEQQIPNTMNKAKLNSEIQAALSTINFPLIFATFLFYFLGGYLIYSALFAAVGAASDSDTDAQQFMMPITIPLILSFVLAQGIIRDPDGSLAFWLSMIPLTSPIIMMVRIPFHPPVWQILLSMSLLLLGFLGIVWIAARIYRVGILMYGKKVTYKELGRWLFYKS